MKFFAIEGLANNANEAINLCASALRENGCVTEDFARDCIDREKEYPTGIPSKAPVAIPHCFTDSILDDAICYLRLENPVTFKRMDDDAEEIQTRHVFCLALSRKNHLDILAKLIQRLQDEEFISTLEHINCYRITEFLESNLDVEAD